MSECKPFVLESDHISVCLRFSFVTNKLWNEKSSNTSFNFIISLFSSHLQDPVIGVQTFTGNVFPEYASSELNIMVKEFIFKCLHQIIITNPCCNKLLLWNFLQKSNQNLQIGASSLPTKLFLKTSQDISTNIALNTFLMLIWICCIPFTWDSQLSRSAEDLRINNLFVGNFLQSNHEIINIKPMNKISYQLYGIIRFKYLGCLNYQIIKVYYFLKNNKVIFVLRMFTQNNVGWEDQCNMKLEGDFFIKMLKAEENYINYKDKQSMTVLLGYYTDCINYFQSKQEQISLYFQAKIKQIVKQIKVFGTAQRAQFYKDDMNKKIMIEIQHENIQIQIKQAIRKQEKQKMQIDNYLKVQEQRFQQRLKKSKRAGTKTLSGTMSMGSLFSSPEQKVYQQQFVKMKKGQETTTRVFFQKEILSEESES